MSKGAILADEVGLGKTIEAGLVISQKWAERKRKILIIVPSNLRKQWNQELPDKFFLSSVILENASFNQEIKKGNLNYVPILKKKLQAFANIIKENLPRDIANEYSFIKPGNVSRNVKDDRFAWVAIKRPKNNRDIFNQCNFTIEVSKSSLDINTVIRNGRTSQESTPIGVFYKRLTNNPDGFLSIIRNIRIDARIVISKRLSKTGNRIMPGNERWVQFFDMKLKDISSMADIEYLRKILEKADAMPSSPGVHIRYSIDRGEKILGDPDRLQEEIIKTITVFRPILQYLEGAIF